MMGGQFHATTIFAIKHKGESVMIGDGQVTLANSVIMKKTAKKVRKLYNDTIIAGFAGSVADAFSLFEKFEGKLEKYSGNLQRSAVELAKDWRSDKVLRKLEALLIVMDNNSLLLISGSGEVIEPDDSMIAIGSGGNYALSAGRALVQYAPELSASDIAQAAMNIAADICVYTNHNFTLEKL